MNEILVSLLGFTGDMIIENEDKFILRPGFTLFTVSEQEQIQSVIILGWYFNKLQSFVSKYEVKWELIGTTHYVSIYYAALSFGILDTLQDYMNNVSLLEQMVSIEKVIPLTTIVQSLQKVLFLNQLIFNLFTIF
jgi:hypothetical protein